jgi:hypothetical protein
LNMSPFLVNMDREQAILAWHSVKRDHIKQATRQKHQDGWAVS